MKAIITIIAILVGSNSVAQGQDSYTFAAEYFVDDVSQGYTNELGYVAMDCEAFYEEGHIVVECDDAMRVEGIECGKGETLTIESGNEVLVITCE